MTNETLKFEGNCKEHTTKHMEFWNGCGSGGDKYESMDL